MSAVLDPPSAVAVAKCMAARAWLPGMSALDPDAFHPRACAWEDFSRADLAAMLSEFNDEAGFDARTGRYGSLAVERFRALAPAHQSALVRAAQYQEVPA